MTPRDCTALILLAAGNSTRMGTPKQLLPFRGRPLVRYVAETALACECGPVIIVSGAYTPEIRAAVAGIDVEVVHNARWPEGMGTSIQAGLRAVSDREEVTGAILALADQPLVTAEFLETLHVVHSSTGKSIVSARYSGTVGVPVLFARSAFPKLMELKPEQGCKGVILSGLEDAVLVDCPEAAVDIDTPEDYARVAGA